MPSPPPLPEGYYIARIQALERSLAKLGAELDALREEMVHALAMLPRRALDRYTRDREARGGPMP